MRSRGLFAMLASGALMAALVPAAVSAAEPTTTTVSYGPLTLSGDQSGHQAEVWDLTACDATLSYTLDASGITQTAPWTTSWTEVGLRQLGAGDFNPGPWNTYQGGAGGWMTSSVGVLTPSPDTQSLMDKLNLSASGGRDELDYDVYAASPGVVQDPTIGSYDNYGIWFDRDGVDQWQAASPGALSGGTYDTGGIYHVVIAYHAINDTLGTMIATVNGIPSEFPYGSPRAGLSFRGDMALMQPFDGIYAPAGAGGSVTISDLSVTGCLNAVRPVQCSATGFDRDGVDLTAAIKDPTVAITGPVDATGCNIGVYYGPDYTGTGSVSGAEVFGANYYGVVANGADVDVADSSIHDIGESPFNGSQHGVGVLYGPSATGTLSGTTITSYQKNGVVVSGADAAVVVENNTVTGQGPIDWIAQNGIQVSYGATALVTGNTVSGDWYTPKSYVACGLLWYQAAGVKAQDNDLFGNEKDVCNVGKGGGNFNP